MKVLKQGKIRYEVLIDKRVEKDLENVLREDITLQRKTKTSQTGNSGSRAEPRASDGSQIQVTTCGAAV